MNDTRTKAECRVAQDQPVEAPEGHASQVYNISIGQQNFQRAAPEVALHAENPARAALERRIVELEAQLAASRDEVIAGDAANARHNKTWQEKDKNAATPLLLNIKHNDLPATPSHKSKKRGDILRTRNSTADKMYAVTCRKPEKI